MMIGVKFYTLNVMFYKLFKQKYETELYATNIYNKGHRSALANFRCGTAPIRLETGRYEGFKY